MTLTSTTETVPPPGTDPKILEDFRQWKAMGQGGMTLDFSGYLRCISMDDKLAYSADSTILPDFYKNPEKSAPGWTEATPVQQQKAWQSFLSEPLVARKGPRSRAKHFCIPQRENDEAVPKPPEVKEAYQAAFWALGGKYANSTEWKTSGLERHGQALFVLPPGPLNPIVASTKGEICHIHGTDLSAHVTLSFADAEEVISKHWGERHRLSGTEVIPLGYTMLYVPRNLKEVEVLAHIMEAGVNFMLSG